MQKLSEIISPATRERLAAIIEADRKERAKKIATVKQSSPIK